jgi:hypothetical protein
MAELEAKHTTTPTVEVKNVWNCTSTSRTSSWYRQQTTRGKNCVLSFAKFNWGVAWHLERGFASLWHKFKFLENTSQICGRRSRENELIKDEIP